MWEEKCVLERCTVRRRVCVDIRLYSGGQWMERHRESQSARSWLPVPFSEKRFPAYALVRGHDMRDENGVSLCTW